MKTDEEIARETPPGYTVQDSRLALVRAGRLAERASTRSMLEALRGELAGPATSVSFLAAEDNEGDAVRWSDVERIFDARLAELGGEDEDPI